MIHAIDLYLITNTNNADSSRTISSNHIFNTETAQDKILFFVKGILKTSKRLDSPLM